MKSSISDIDIMSSICFLFLRVEVKEKDGRIFQTGGISETGEKRIRRKIYINKMSLGAYTYRI